MIHGERVLAVVPARGGSKGIPRKNIHELGGRPLIEWTLTEAGRSAYLDRVVVSTDDDEIAEVCRSLGADVPFMRPVDAATDEAPGSAPLLHACQSLPGYDLAVLLQPTSPLRLASDIDACIEACVLDGHRTATTIAREQHGVHLLRTLSEYGHLVSVVPDHADTGRRQDAPATFRLNGAVYVARVSDVLAQRPLVDGSTVGVEMPAERSVDVDTLDDMALAEFRLAQRNLGGGGGRGEGRAETDQGG